MEYDYDYIIVGGGVAGLSIAETISRYKKSVLLIEKNKKFGSESSAKHQNWFHAGSLYGIVNDFEYMNTAFRNLFIISDHYKDFKNNNLKLKKKKIDFEGNGWFNQERINYLVVARNHPIFKKNNIIKNFIEIAKWELRIKKFISRHNAISNIRLNQNNLKLKNINIFDYSNRKIQKGIIKNSNFDPNTHFLLEGFDTTMNSNLIMKDLLNEYLKNNGQIMLNTEVMKISDNEIHLSNQKILNAKRIVLANSKNINKLTNKKIIDTKVSPIAIIKPALKIQNFAKLAPFENDTINHLSQIENGFDVSMIADGSYCDEFDIENQKINEINLKKKILENINLDKNRIHIYSSYKSEFTSKKKERNYLFGIYDYSKIISFAIPGKFSFCFSLAKEFEDKYLKEASLETKKIIKNFDLNIISRPYFSYLDDVK